MTLEFIVSERVLRPAKGWGIACARQVSGLFNPLADQPSPAEVFLKSQRIPFKRRGDGTLYVRENIYVSFRNQGQLPDLSNVILDASFHCQGAQLISLKGSPLRVSGDFYCFDNNLATLEGATRDIGGSFCCNENELISLAGAPRRVGRDFVCKNNLLRSLNGAPAVFKEIVSDFGTFTSWNAVPEDVRISRQEHIETVEKIAEAVIALDAPIRLSRPITLTLRR